METPISLFEESGKLGMFLVGKRSPSIFNAFLNLAHEVMHNGSALSQLQRELLGAYVSKKFGCSFCYLGHLETASVLGGDEVRLLADHPDTALSILFDMADKVISNSIKEDDVRSFLSKGYTEKHYEDIVYVCALFGFANRMVTGFGIEYVQSRDQHSSRYLAKGYKINQAII
ncbi:MAG: hypothetical protein MUF24_06010 [Chitinophagaceae bacterium]|nr:hypothetical protein [Chitinophagaceae bacterium]